MGLAPRFFSSAAFAFDAGAFLQGCGFDATAMDNFDKVKYPAEC